MVEWHYGPTDSDPDPGKMWHYGCGGEVLYLKGGWICSKCNAQEADLCASEPESPPHPRADYPRRNTNK